MDLPENLEPTLAWREIRAELRRNVGESTFEIWLAPLEVKSFHTSALILEAPSPTKAWVAKRFGRVLESSAEAVLHRRVAVAISGTTSPDDATPAPRPLLEADTATFTFNPRYSFDQFIIGDGNRLAHAASLAVAELPGQAYNPLFLYASPGLGKTHLLHAIGNYVSAFGAGSAIRYATVEAFTNQFISALSSHSLDRFKRTYRNADILLIDDVQFLASKVKTEEEFFHTFNAMYETGRQLVVSCDRLPQQLVSIEKRLRERFGSGLVAEIKPADFATRVAILRKRALLDHISLADQAVLEVIADRVTDNIRALEGALIRVVAHHSLSGQPLDVAFARDVLDRMYPAVPSQASIAEVQATVASFYDISITELLSTSRTARIAWPRQVAIQLARELTDASLQTLGEAFGNRNHATILHACKRVSQRITVDPRAAMDITELTQMIAGTDRAC